MKGERPADGGTPPAARSVILSAKKINRLTWPLGGSFLGTLAY